MPLSDDDVREILRIVDESELDELKIETAEFMLHVRKGGACTPGPAAGPARVDQDLASGAEASSDGLLVVAAPMLGTFYRAQGPGQEPFVELGSAVEPDTVVCIIEVMKMMNSVPAGVAGTVVEICPENAELVEYGAPLFKVAPA